MDKISQGEILIVEDSPESLQLLSEVLSFAGFNVRQAQDGEMALATIHSRLPDLILMDVEMPHMDGYAVCRKLKESDETKNIPVIFCTAMHDTEYKIKGFNLGAVDFITKPYQPEEVLVRVRTHVELSRLRISLEQRVAERTAELQATANSLAAEVAVRRQVEQELRLSSQAFESSFSCILVTDSEGTILATNPAFTRITGYTKEYALGKTPRILKSGKHDVTFYQSIWETLQNTGSWSGEIWNRKQDGNMIPMLENIHAIKGDDGAVTHYISTLTDLSESKDAQTLIDFLAYRDSLTGLSNRLVARTHLEKIICDAEAQNKKIAFLVMDLDRFKVINDSLGHAVGDQLLKMIANRCLSCFNEDYLVTREGGDEFLIISPCLDSLDPVIELAEKIVSNMSNEIEVDHHLLSVTTSIGVAVYPDDGAYFDELLKNAENALYNAKKQGGNTYSLFTDEMDAEARNRMEMENCLRNAVANNELQLVYQPKLSLVSGLVVGAEALVRWNSPQLGFVSPADFIPLAEETGLILTIDEWVVESACQQVRQWIDAGLGEFKISVNLSALQFHRGNLKVLVQRVLEKSGISGKLLDLEITEGVLMENIRNAAPVLDGLKETGVSISLDDFGTGYSSLSYLQKLPINTLKIDKSFVDEVHTKQSHAAIARTIIALGKNLDLNIVAEGVEYQEQMDFLSQQGCDEMQGYLFSKPLAVNDFELLVKNHTADDVVLPGHVRAS